MAAAAMQGGWATQRAREPVRTVILRSASRPGLSPKVRGMKFPKSAIVACVLAPTMALLSGCAVGPDYQRPAVEAPVAFKEMAGWKMAEPRSIAADQPWWTLYADPVLSGFIEDATRANNSIALAAANYRQAQALVDQARAGQFPTVGASVGGTRAHTNTNGTARIANTFSAGLTASWEPDFWGAIRRQVELQTDAAAASAADLATARLSVQASLAQNYFQVRVIDLTLASYERTIAGYRKSLQLTQSQYAAGTALRSDVALAESTLQTAIAQQIDLRATRAQLEHATAVLTGRAPANFAIVPLEAMTAQMPIVPPGLPSDLLERRPDIAAAERRVAAANANIGVAQAAYYPSLTLSASGGFGSPSFSNWFDAPARVWSLGATLAQNLFDGGLRRARSAQAVAAYDGTVATYKQTVLGGFQEVEDNLALLRILEEESAAQAKAVDAAAISERLALVQYRAGSGTYLNVITTQNLSLTAQRTALSLLSRRMVASVGLIKATGGGWTAGPAVAQAQ